MSDIRIPSQVVEKLIKKAVMKAINDIRPESLIDRDNQEAEEIKDEIMEKYWEQNPPV